METGIQICGEGPKLGRKCLQDVVGDCQSAAKNLARKDLFFNIVFSFELFANMYLGRICFPLLVLQTISIIGSPGFLWA